MFLNILITFLLPLQIHPLSLERWHRSPVVFVQATIDAARIIGLPRLKIMDSSMHRTIYINEFQSGAAYHIHPRRAFIREYVK